MPRQSSLHGPPHSFLLYGLGLALAGSLVFNGFLLLNQLHPVSVYENDVDLSGTSAKNRDRPLPPSTTNRQAGFRPTARAARQPHSVPAVPTTGQRPAGWGRPLPRTAIK